MPRLPPAPAALLGARGVVQWGSYEGAIDGADVGVLASRAERLFRRKRWMWVGVAAGDVFAGAAVVDLGYAASAFAFAYDDAARAMLFDRSAMGLRADVQPSGGARFRSRALSVTLGPREMEIASAGVEVHATFDEGAAPPAITAVAPVPGGKINVTRKRALLPARGAAKVGGRTIALDGGLAGYDLTQGLLARRTAWRWAFAMGRGAGGAPVGVNLVEGFVGAAECARFDATSATPLAEGRFTFDPRRPLEEWRVESTEVDLRFRPGGAHVEKTNLLVVRSRFVQAVGSFVGTLGGEAVRLLGVAEDQDVVW